MESENQRPNFLGVVELVIDLVGEILDRGIVHEIVAHYNGDLNQSVDKIMNMYYDGRAPEDGQLNTPSRPCNQPIQPIPTDNAASQHTASLETSRHVEMADRPKSSPRVPQSEEAVASIKPKENDPKSNESVDRIMNYVEGVPDAKQKNTSSTSTPRNQSSQPTPTNNADGQHTPIESASPKHPTELKETGEPKTNQSVDTTMNMKYVVGVPEDKPASTSSTPCNQSIQPTPINNAGSQHTPSLDAPRRVEMADRAKPYPSQIEGAVPKQPTKPKEINIPRVNQSVEQILNIGYDERADKQINISRAPGNSSIQPNPINNAGSQDMTQNLNISSVETTDRLKLRHGAAQSKGAVPKQPTIPKEMNMPTCNIWTLQTKQIVDYHHQGSRTLILMRGLHISGKSYLAKQLLQTMCPDADVKTHILSIDDYHNREHRYDKKILSEAHYWNQNRARDAMHRGVSPIFIDNCNVEIYEMEPYVKDGINNGYIIEVLEPNTPWSKKANQLVEKKDFPVHNQNEIYMTGVYLIRKSGLSYSAHKKPPVRRNIPPLLATTTASQLDQPISTNSDQASVLVTHSSTIQKISPILSTSYTLKQSVATSSDQTSGLLPHSATMKKKIETNIVQDGQEYEVNSSRATATFSNNDPVPYEDKEQLSNVNKPVKTLNDDNNITFSELRKQLEQFDKFYLKRNNDPSRNKNTEARVSTHSPKIPVITDSRCQKAVESVHCVPSTSNYNAGSKNSTATQGTSIELSDSDINNKKNKILLSTPRDINFYYMGVNDDNTLKTRMLDKSSMTNNHDFFSESSYMETDIVDETSSSDCESTVNINLGTIFLSDLDRMFGRSDMVYPDNITTRVNLPISLLSEINAFWIESLTDQLEQQSRQTEHMLRQDEEFARQLALKEEQLTQAGFEPAVPDLEQIKDMELALSIYKNEITAEWRNNEPDDFAARTIKERLYHLFPEVPHAILSELLMAHDNNFEATVEILLSSTSNSHILEEQDGVSKFIAKKELERQKKILEEQKKAVSEVKWPLLLKEVKVDMSTFQDYRAKAAQYLAKRNMYYNKAQEFFKRDMMDMASYYSDVAVMHKNKFEQANSLAAASLMQIHAEKSDNATIDLHFLHVAEAKESLDLFIDSHIQKLRDAHAASGPRYHTLFFITGRGKHSPGGPRIKPAIKIRLRQRGIAFAERNPGLLTSKVCAEDKLTHQLA